jgi:hypothetical protein
VLPSFYICRAHGLAAEPALELLISNPLKSKAPVVPTLAERALRPLVGNRTLRGFDFSSAAPGPFEGLAYVVRSQAVLMPIVVTVVVRCGRTFSSDAAARVVGNMGWRT